MEKQTTEGRRAVYAEVRRAFAAGEGTAREIAARLGISYRAARNALQEPRRRPATWGACLRKLRYVSFDEAQLALGTLRAARPDNARAKDAKVYACGHCGGFHYGVPIDQPRD